MQMNKFDKEPSQEALHSVNTSFQPAAAQQISPAVEVADVRPLITPNTLIPVSPTGIPHKYIMMAKPKLIGITVAVVLGYIGLWFSYGFAKDELWSASDSFTEKISQYGGFLLVYCWTFSEIFYKWYMIIVPLLLLLAPRKDSALKSIVVFVISYTVRQYIRLWVAETRPYYNNTNIVLRLTCDCSYGMPSGHAEGSAMLYSLLFYELFAQANCNRKRRIGLTAAWVFIVFSVMFSRIYFGRHSIAQVFLGMWQGLLAFFLMLAFEPFLNNYAVEFLNGSKKVVIFAVYTSLLFPIISVVLWYTSFEKEIETNTLPHQRCYECWQNNSSKLRSDLGPALMFPWLLPGLLLGLFLAKVCWTQCNLDLFRQHFSKVGLYRFLIVAACYAPLLLVIGISYSPNIKTPVSVIIYFGTGLLLGYAPPNAFQKWNLTFAGDITVKK